VTSTAYVGTTVGSSRLVRARFVAAGGHPAHLVDILVSIWAANPHRCSLALVRAILDHDWQRLDPTAGTHGTTGDQHPVPGIGVPLPTPAGEAPEPASVFPLSHAEQLDADWIYLIDPVTVTVAVFTDDGEPAGRYLLTAPALQHPAHPAGDLTVAGVRR
jgi:hypothetical protein